MSRTWPWVLFGCLLLGGAALRAADCNGNGIDDAVDVEVSVAPPAGSLLCFGTASAATADFDNDGLADLLVVNSESNGVTYLRGTAAGFAPGGENPVGHGPVGAVAASDMDDDGDFDLAVVSLFTCFYVLFGDAVPTSQDANGNGVPDACDGFRRGDATVDQDLNVADALAVLEYLFLGGDDPPCLDAADANDSGSVTITDGVKSLQHLFAGEIPLPDPFESCGLDPTPDALGALPTRRVGRGEGWG